MAMAISSGIARTPSPSMLSRDQLFHLFSRFSQLTSLPDVKKRIADAFRDDNQEAVAVTTAIQEIFSEMGVDAGFGISCLGKLSSYYENDLELMVHFYKFVAMEEMACDEAELEPDEFAEKMNNQQKLHDKVRRQPLFPIFIESKYFELNVLFIQQLEMLQHMRKLNSDDQSAILEKLHQQLESVEFDSSASILSSEEIQEIVQRTSPASV
ncbi:plant/MOJ10-14 protein [Cucumis melo var. makuwa]|uniref:Plant/MOJ10-14 protein n=1 Tax=Cucumis melo var. makuwa TaxID=1194695 RepID=A0A5A7TNX1_CUCMM|nr:plant/MOJ10-14 protein [Cucumis melo var. makuwa]